MTDFEHIVPLWRELEACSADYVLATIVAVEGSSYRRPGTRMLLAQDGRRAGTVSGGCLEASVAKKAFWLTAEGPVLERYSTLDDDGDLPYGSGCGGIVTILLERRATASPLLHALHTAFSARVPLGFATVIEGPGIGRRAFTSALTNDVIAPQLYEDRGLDEDRAQGDLTLLATQALEYCKQRDASIDIDGAIARVWVDYRPARPGLWIFGAGDDARPLLNLARELGWFVAVVDGRSHLATPARFPNADEVCAVDIGEFPDRAPLTINLHSTDAVVLITHSFEQDSRILAWIFGRARPLAYIGVLGPQRRTREALTEAARLLQRDPSEDLIDQWLDDLHAPTGLDLGADTPASIALSILAEVQNVLNAGTALPLRNVRALKSAASHI